MKGKEEERRMALMVRRATLVDGGSGESLSGWDPAL